MTHVRNFGWVIIGGCIWGEIIPTWAVNLEYFISDMCLWGQEWISTLKYCLVVFRVSYWIWDTDMLGSNTDRHDFLLSFPPIFSILVCLLILLLDILFIHSFIYFPSYVGYLQYVWLYPSWWGPIICISLDLWMAFRHCLPRNGDIFHEILWLWFFKTLSLCVSLF